LIAGFPPPQSIGHQVEFDFISGGVSVLTSWERYPDECPTCGRGSESDWEAFAIYDQAALNRAA
jgi:hypothetical protein